MMPTCGECEHYTPFRLSDLLGDGREWGECNLEVIPVQGENEHGEVVELTIYADNHDACSRFSPKEAADGD